MSLSVGIWLLEMLVRVVLDDNIFSLLNTWHLDQPGYLGNAHDKAHTSHVSSRPASAIDKLLFEFGCSSSLCCQAPGSIIILFKAANVDQSIRPAYLIEVFPSTIVSFNTSTTSFIFINQAWDTQDLVS